MYKETQFIEKNPFTAKDQTQWSYQCIYFVCWAGVISS